MTPRSFQFDTLEEFAEFTPLDLVRVKSQSRAAEIVEAAIRDLLFSLATQREEILADFLVSGAMPWDIRVEEGRPELTSVSTIGAGEQRYRWTARQHFRIV